MTVLGPLVGEPSEPMTKEAFDLVRKRLRESWNGSVTLEKRQVEQLVAEITWLKRRLHRVESAIEPLVSDIINHQEDGATGDARRSQPET